MTHHRNWYTEEKQPWQIELERRYTNKEIDLLAAAILRLLDWQSRQLELKEQRKIKAMIKRLRLRQNREFRLSD